PIATQIQNLKIRGKKGKGRSFIFRMNSDTLHIDSLHFYFHNALQKAGFEVPFHVRHIKANPLSENHSLVSFGIPEIAYQESTKNMKSILRRDTVLLDAVRFNPLNRY